MDPSLWFAGQVGRWSWPGLERARGISSRIVSRTIRRKVNGLVIVLLHLIGNEAGCQQSSKECTSGAMVACGIPISDVFSGVLPRVLNVAKANMGKVPLSAHWSTSSRVFARVLATAKNRHV